ncbi:MAG: hypothetical protein MUO62_08645, partial [Anaerolineales bacterium]|nr:hypothetical protein [Anaerolineales bacterium]
MIFPASFFSIVASALRASRAYQGHLLPGFETPLTPAAAPAVFPEALPGDLCFCKGAIYTNYAEHTEKFSHDMANRYLAGDEIRPRLVWENVKGQVVQTPYGFLV